MSLHADYTPAPEDIDEPTTGRYCNICLETWHEPYAHKSGPFWHVPASDGKYYFVYKNRCGCPSFHFGRRPCKHLTYVHQLEVQNLKHDLPNVTWVHYEQLRWPEDVTLDEIKGSID